LAKNNVPEAEKYYKKALDLNQKYKQAGGGAYNEYELGVSLQRRKASGRRITTTTPSRT
jgi:hypothetical protein